MNWAPPYCPRFHLWEVLLAKRPTSFHQKDGHSEPLSSIADDKSQNLNKLIYNYNHTEDKKHEFISINVKWLQRHKIPAFQSILCQKTHDNQREYRLSFSHHIFRVWWQSAKGHKWISYKINLWHCDKIRGFKEKFWKWWINFFLQS